MIALYILGALVLLIVLVLFLNLHITFSYQDQIDITCRILFIRFHVLSLVERMQKKGKDAPKKKPDAPKKEKESVKKGRGSPRDFLEFILLITRIVREGVALLFDKIHIKLSLLQVSFGTEDAASTALLYGAVTQAAYGLVALLQRFSHFAYNPEALTLRPDFTGKESSFAIHLTIRLKPIHLLQVFFHSYFLFLEGKDGKK